jgi:NAD(P)-dependent dehydrogenase (short-subunit alcohol dehydrogenase family)
MTRSVLITGGTGGLGAAVTNRFLEEDHNVVATSRLGGSVETVTGSLTHFGEQLHLLQADVREWDSVAELVDRTVAKFGTIDVLVHLVGGWEAASRCKTSRSRLGSACWTSTCVPPSCAAAQCCRSCAGGAGGGSFRVE